MKKNASIKILSAVVIGSVALILLNSRSQSPNLSQKKHDPNNFNAAIASQFNDNVRDVSARLLETEKKMRALEQQNKVLVAKKTKRALPSETPDRSSELFASIESLKQELNDLKIARESDIKQPIYPLEKTSTQPSVVAKKHIKDKPMPYYTIPAGSDLGHTTLMSALIGEVPNEGKLMQPLFPFTAIISRGDLMASNGVPLPTDISGMKINGYAIGVGSFLDNISCVRAYVTSALFTFQDGHFVTVGHEQMTNTTELVNNESIGYLTSQYGNPCIHGKYFTNAPRVLGAMMASGGVQGIGAALSQWQMSYFSSANGITGAPTGSFIPYATGSALAEGSVKAADWLEKRIQGSFDMVFVPASLIVNGHYRPNQVSLHLTQTIAIDKQPNGRLLDYAHLQMYTHDFSL